MEVNGANYWRIEIIAFEAYNFIKAHSLKIVVLFEV